MLKQRHDDDAVFIHQVQYKCFSGSRHRWMATSIKKYSLYLSTDDEKVHSDIYKNLEL